MSDRIWEEPFQGLYGSLAPLRRPGLERFQPAPGDPGGPDRRPPIHFLLGLRPTEQGIGTCVFTMPSSRWLLNPSGAMIGGVLALVADAPLTGAIITGLPPGKIATTSELSLHYLRPPQVASRLFTARAAIVHATERMGLAQAQITDADGRLVGYGSTRTVTLDVPDALAPDLDPARLAGTRGPGEGTPPHLREPVGHVNPPAYYDDKTPREALAASLAGDHGPPPVYFLTGLRLREIEERAAVFTLPTSEWLCSPAPFLYGGALAWLADNALVCAEWLAMEAGQIPAPIDLKVQFLRPVFPGTGELTARATVAHRGRQVVVAQCEVRDASGKRVALATGSAMVVRGGVRRLLASDETPAAYDGD